MVVGLSINHDKQNNNKYGALIATMNNTQTAFYNHVEQYIDEQDLPKLFATSMIRKYMSFTIVCLINFNKFFINNKKYKFI